MHHFRRSYLSSRKKNGTLETLVKFKGISLNSDAVKVVSHEALRNMVVTLASLVNIG